MTTTQDGRLLRFEMKTLDKDFLLVDTFKAEERLSGLYQYEIELLHEEDDEGNKATDVDITLILGQEATITIEQEDGTTRIFNGIFNSFVKRNRTTRFSYYNATVVPKIWYLTQNRQSRIFQHKSVEEILEEVFEGFRVSFEIQGEYERRNYCVQYRESDFDFASRLMEEEGFYYYFEHKDNSHKMVVADTPQSHLDNPSKSEIDYQVELSEKEGFVSYVRDLEIDFTLNPGGVSFRDRNFQLPNYTLETVQPSLYQINNNKSMQVYDFPGGYARKYDGIDRMGGSNEAGMKGLFPDRDRTAEIAMEVFDVKHEVLRGTSDCCAFTSGYRFKLQRHPNKELNRYNVVRSVVHMVRQTPAYISGDDVENAYVNHFTCIAHGAGKPQFRPERITPKPIVQGSQIATVVGPSGEEIFTDKYGRVKVQFPWDRQGQVDENSSCWIRVSQSWAGNGWGSMFIPRIGMEVIVDFLEGDPDQPIINGCVYNPDMVPPYTLPDEKTKSTIKTDSTKGGGGFNEIRFEDKKDEEQVFVHGQKDIDVRNLNDRREWVGNDHHFIVTNDRRDKVRRDEHRIVERHQHEKVDKDRHTAIGGADNHSVGGTYSLTASDDVLVKTSAFKVAGSVGVALEAPFAVIDADEICLRSTGGFIRIDGSGVSIVGNQVKINSGGANFGASPANPAGPAPPKEPDKADDAQPGSKPKLLKNSNNRKEKTHRDGDPTKTSWIKIKLVDEAGNPVPGVYYKVTAPDGRVASGSTNVDGKAEVKNIDPGSAKITFPDLDKDAWEEG
ncbi:MAG: type VI secretion system tip protein VgrG [Pyrinomonadaceae bacterium]|nr:type VI secretion system tip protein VgrG [Pyrinomonadaceae bacterium]